MALNVYIQYKLNTSGKGLFLSRLIPALKDIGVECRFKEKGCDVCLGISKWRGSTKLPKVLRVDGVHLEPGHEAQNHAIKKSIQSADAVIFQSKFAQSKVKEVLKVKPRKEYVIYNGANPKDYENQGIDRYIGHTLISGKWERKGKERKQKNLKMMLDIAYMYCNKNPYNHFHVAGKTKLKSPHENIIMHGYLKEKELRKLIAMCDSMLNAPTVDWMPNAVVEAKVAGLKLIVNHKKCPVMKEIKEAPREAFFISNIAKQYKKVFYEVSKKKN